MVNGIGFNQLTEIDGYNDRRIVKFFDMKPLVIRLGGFSRRGHHIRTNTFENLSLCLSISIAAAFVFNGFLRGASSRLVPAYSGALSCRYQSSVRS